MRTPYLIIWIGLVLLGTPVRADSSASHFIYLFAIDDGSQTPALNHTLATFVEATQGSDSSYTFRQHTISWLPRSGKINALAAGPNRGQNLPLAESLNRGMKDNLTLAQWGPYQTTEAFYNLSVQQKARLDSGNVWYRFLDTTNRIFKVLDPPTVPAPGAVNSVHAVSDIVYSIDSNGFMLSGIQSGIVATSKVALHFANWYVRYGANVNYLAPLDTTLKSQMDQAVGVTAYPTLQPQTLQSQVIPYCSTLKKCMDTANNLIP